MVLPAHVKIKSSLPLRTNYFQETRSDAQAGSSSPATKTVGNNSVVAEGVVARDRLAFVSLLFPKDSCTVKTD